MGLASRRDWPRLTEGGGVLGRPFEWERRFITERRVRAYAWITLIALLVLWSAYLLSTTRLLPLGSQMGGGTDFRAFYGAATLAAHGQAALTYDTQAITNAEHQADPRSSGYLPWNYPPDILLVIAPLAYLPYYAAYGLWVLIGTGCYLAALRAIAPLRGLVITALSFGGWFFCAFLGQNGALSAAILGTGLALLDARPVLAGLTLGMLTYKPHLAFLVPVVLVATGRWRQFFAFVAGAAALLALGALLFGLSTPWMFVRHMGDAAHLLKVGAFGYGKMPTVAASLLLLHAPFPLAMAGQALTSMAAAAIAVTIWRSGSSMRVKAATLPAAALLSTPYAYDYDLAILAVSGAFLIAEARETGWLRGEKAALVVVWAGTLVFVTVALATGIQFGPILVAVPLLLATRRWLANRGIVPVPNNESRASEAAVLVVAREEPFVALVSQDWG